MSQLCVMMSQLLLYFYTDADRKRRDRKENVRRERSDWLNRPVRLNKENKRDLNSNNKELLLPPLLTGYVCQSVCVSYKFLEIMTKDFNCLTMKTMEAKVKTAELTPTKPIEPLTNIS